MSEEKEDEGFVIKDKRSSHQSDDEIKETDQERSKEQAKEKARNQQAESEQADQGPMEINYSTFVLSLSSSAFYYLGDLPDPTTGQVQENLPAVKQTIDILVMLKEKTQGNLNAEEDKLMDQLIYELQMKYVAKQNKQSSQT